MEDFVPYKKWQNQQNEKIKAEFAERPTEAIAEEMGVNYYTVARRAARLGIGKSDAFMRKSWKKGGTRKGCKRVKSNEESDNYLRAHFADTKNEDLARHLGVDVKTVRRWARRLGLVKSEAFMQEARKRGRWNRKNGARYYTDEQEAWRRQRIAEVYPDGDDEALRQLAEELGVRCRSIKAMAAEFGISRSAAYISAARRELATKYGPEFIEELKAYYPTHTNEECAEHFGMSKGSVFQLALRHGIRKTPEHKSKVYSQNNRKKRG